MDDLDGFWSSVWEYFEVSSLSDPGPALAEKRMPGASWFPDARLNWAEHCLRLAGRAADETVLVARSQTRDRIAMSADELREAVGRAMKVDRVLAEADPNARRGYELRAARSEPGLEPGSEDKQLTP